MKYINPYQRKICRGFRHFILWRFGYYKEKYPCVPLPEGFSFPNPRVAIDLTKPLVTWVNHSTFWIQTNRTSLLVDPIWNKRCSPLPFMGPKRHHPPPFSLKNIEKLDVVIITHNHYDHLDYFTIKQLQYSHPTTLWVVPRGVKKWFHQKFPYSNVKELSWWEGFEHKGMRFTSVPAQHFSGRGLFDRNRSLWMGCVVELTEGKRVYFAGDTGYNPFDFKKIQEQFSYMDLSLIPIGAYRPRDFMRAVHINPHESAYIHADVNSKLSIGGHWGTFRLGGEAMDRPPFDLYCALEKLKISHEAFRILKPGEQLNF